MTDTSPKPKHTPGPWLINDKRGGAFSGGTYIQAESGSIDVCQLLGCSIISGDEQKANAFLIAAAPDMLTALEVIGSPLAPAGFEDATPTHEDVISEYTRRVAIARAAIAKAKGMTA